jgi:hypothetical protein
MQSLRPAGCSCRGIVGAFEIWKPDLDYACMSGDIASTAGLTVHERLMTGGPFREVETPSIRMPFPALRSWRQRARTMGQVGEAADTGEKASSQGQ